MKFDCEVVQDLYVLYEENELSPNVRARVDEHLQSCSTCREIYESGQGFSSEVKVDNETIAPSPSLDEKIKMKLKLRKMKIALLFMASLLVIYSYLNYEDNRKWLVHELSIAAPAINDLRFQVDSAKSDYEFDRNVTNKTMELQDINSRIVRYLNFLEKRDYENTTGSLFISFHLNDFLVLLNERYRQGLWNETDEIAFERINNLIFDYIGHVEEERDRVSLFSRLDIGKIVEFHDQINELTYNYTRFQKLPEQVELLSQSEVENRLISLLDLEDKNVTINFLEWANQTPKSNGQYSVEIRSKDRGGITYSVTVDAFTGQLIKFDSFTREDFTGDVLPEAEVRESIQNLLQKQYSDLFEWDFEFLGMNYNFRSNRDHQLYSYLVTPIYEGYKIEQSLLIYVDGRSGQLYRFIGRDGNSMIDHSLLPSSFKIDITIEEGLNNLEKREDQKLSYDSTRLLKSFVLGNYQLVHVYKDQHGQKRYVNTVTGKEEIVLYY